MKEVIHKHFCQINVRMIKHEYDRIVRIGQSILSLHQEKEWKDKTRSNYAQYSLESVYHASEELENVLLSWKRIAEFEYKDYDRYQSTLCEQDYEKCRKAKRNYNQIFKRSQIMTDCINVLKNFKDVVKAYIIRPLIEVFPRPLPFEVLQYGV